MSPGSSTESYPAFAHIGLRENTGKNLNQITCPDRESNPDHLVSRLDALTVTPQVWTGGLISALNELHPLNNDILSQTALWFESNGFFLNQEKTINDHDKDHNKDNNRRDKDHDKEKGHSKDHDKDNKDQLKGPDKENKDHDKDYDKVNDKTRDRFKYQDENHDPCPGLCNDPCLGTCDPYHDPCYGPYRDRFP
ncbi:hypothetical protein ANN_17590 [Periplaneta americana]|uniref:Uncharacterized protein n=1 Tax=Periplaneta americana TaxID=6978 RepID=A0ABQ8SUP6_PERAM|nr:hypothetical protein ANN_17590 [Periplaneta americana]